SPDGETIAVTCSEASSDIRLTARPHGVVRLYSVSTGEEMAVLKGHTAPPSGVAFSPDGMRIVTAGGMDSIKLWDAKNGEESLTLGRHPGIVPRVSFSGDGQKIVSGSIDTDVRVWDATPLKK